VPASLLRDTSQRRASEFLVPSSMILAGVLAVVAFAVAVNWGLGRPDEPAALPPAQPPALGSQPLAPAEQWYFPTPSTAPSPSARPSESPRATRSAERPPPRSRVKAPAGALTVKRSAVPSVVDLTAEGDRDWVHWGLDGTFSLERRRTGRFAILEGTPTAPRHRHALSPQQFLWDNGSPVLQTSGTPSGIRTCGAGNGFTLSAPAGGESRTLRLYVGVATAHGRLDARLSTGGAPVVAALDSRTVMGTAVFTLTYRAPRTGTLKITWVTERTYATSCSGVALQAVTLR
jgi:hypothetical protein